MAEEEYTKIKTKRLKALLRAERFLQCLKECGVDNWEGYSEAQELAFGGDPDEDETKD